MSALRKRIEDALRNSGDDVWKTIIVRNLPMITVRADIRHHFCDVLHTDPDTVVVGPLVPHMRDNGNGSAEGKEDEEFALGTTVTIPDSLQGLKRLRENSFRPGYGPLPGWLKFNMDVKEELVGLFGLEQHDRESEPYSHEFE